MLRLCEAEGIGVIPWSPLARGRLTRDWDESSARSETDEFGKTLYARTGEADRKVVQRVAEIASRRGVPRAQVALAWLLHKPVDRKSTRLNSSHANISYAVFCLKKK